MEKEAAVTGRKQEARPVAISTAMRQLTLPLLLAKSADKEVTLPGIEALPEAIK